MQTAEGELSVEVPQVREAAEPFVSRLFPRGTKLLRTEPLLAATSGQQQVSDHRTQMGAVLDTCGWQWPTMRARRQSRIFPGSS